MTGNPDYSVDSARIAAGEGRLADWVSRFLASPGSDNPELAELLDGRLGWWTGPVCLPTDRLHRLAGPPGDPVLRSVGDDYWRSDVAQLGDKVEQGLEPPPVVVTYADGRLQLEDGNHRVEAVRQAGRDRIWAVVGFETATEHDRFARLLASATEEEQWPE